VLFVRHLAGAVDNTRSAKNYYSAELVISVTRETVMDYSRLRLFIL